MAGRVDSQRGRSLKKRIRKIGAIHDARGTLKRHPKNAKVPEPMISHTQLETRFQTREDSTAHLL